MILGANYAELDKLNPHNPVPKFVFKSAIG